MNVFILTDNEDGSRCLQTSLLAQHPEGSSTSSTCSNDFVIGMLVTLTLDLLKRAIFIFTCASYRAESDSSRRPLSALSPLTFGYSRCMRSTLVARTVKRSCYTLNDEGRTLLAHMHALS